MDKKDILNNLTQDAQENARFIESKTAIIFAIIGAILIYYLQDIKNIIKYFDSFSYCNYFFFSLVILSTFFNIFILFNIIFPISNPISKIPKYYKKYPNIYLSKTNLNIKNQQLSELKESLSSSEKLEKALELEYVKTSYIRNNKLHFYRILVFSLFVHMTLFIVHLTIYNLELIRLTAD